ncbi:hypothetical protein [Novosphingobium sp.]|uniref:hypothetical protein n=1 Tax=Novosphingobium sp. TaxID=1874826 RepID=UPI002B48BC65|nr:hypothetical protein [Novosphingobium sp.]HKR93305.1 hypothetical protein [Novosphingobium sp.]
MSLAVNPLGNAIIAVCYLADSTPIAFLALMALLVLQAVDHPMNAIGFVVTDLIFIHLVPQTILKAMSALARANGSSHAVVVIVVIIAIMSGGPAVSDVETPALSVGGTACEKPRT